VRLERIGHLRVLTFRREAIVNELAPGAVLLELGSTFGEGVGTPERAAADVAILLHDAVLFEQLGDQDVERADRHDRQHDSDEQADPVGLAAREHHFVEAEVGLAAEIARL